ncbi:MAG: hypothetical protein DRJ38_03535, partial [Thermoprotei archaeon]
MQSTDHRLEPFTPDDARYLLSVLDSVNRGRDPGVIAVSATRASMTVISIDELDLEAMVSSTHGIMDPIGQLQQWLYDRFKELSSWFADAVGGVFETFYNTFIKPVIDSISSVVNNIWSYIQQVPGTFMNLLEWLENQLSGAWNWIQQNIIGPLSEGLSQFVDWVSEAINTVTKFITEDLPSLLSQIPSMIQEAVAGAWDWIQTYIISPLNEAISNIVQWVQSGVDTLIRFFTQDLPNWLGQIPSMIQEAVSGAWEWIQQHIIAPLQGAFQQFVDWVQSGINTLVRFFTQDLPNWLGQIPATIQQFLGQAWNWIQQHIIGPLSDAFQQFAQWIQSGIDTLTRFFTQDLPNWFAQIPNMFQQLLGQAWDWIQQHIISPLQSAFQTVTEWIQSGIETLTNFFTRDLPNFFSQIPSMIQEAWDWIQRNVIARITGAFQQFVDWIGGAFDTTRRLFEELWNRIAGGFQWLTEQLEGFGKWLEERFEQVGDWLRQIVDTISKVPEYLKQAFDWITKIGEELGKVWEGVQNFFRPLAVIPDARAFIEKVSPELAREWDQLISEIRSPLDWITNFPRILWLSARTVGAVVWYFMPEEVKDWFERISKYLDRVGVAIMGFVNSVAQLPSMLYEKFKGFLQGIVDALQSIGNFFGQLWEGLQQFAKDPWGWIQKNIAEPIWRGLQWIGQKIVEGVQWVWSVLGDLAARILECLKAGGAWLLGAVRAAMDAVIGFVHDVAEVVGGALSRLLSAFVEARSPSPLDQLASPFRAFVDRVFKPLLDQLVGALSSAVKNPVAFMYQLLSFGVMFSAAAHGIRIIIDPIVESLPMIEVLGSPMGMGGRFRFMLSRIIRSVSEQVEKIMPDVARYMIIGHMIWWAEPTRAVTRYNLTEYVTVELPPLEHALNLVRRSIPTPTLMDNYKMFVDQLRMGGIYKGFIEKLYGLPSKLAERIRKSLGDVSRIYDSETMSVVIKDRFGMDRHFPTTLVGALPTPSELARMMIRDIIQDPRHFATVMAMHGFTPDIAFMFYLLHYRYPPPEKLADFFWRGIAGELWNPEAPVDAGLLATFGIDPTTWRAVAPKELNFNYDVLKDMISTYMKWHDYARFPWQPGWTTDNAIIIELMADIPTKIDLRWMTRWGLFDYWSAHGVGLRTAIHEITKRLIPDRTTCPAKPMIDRYLEYLRTGEIVFDLKQFCRVLQATGIHPYWIPWVAIAESINALTEERTLLRTGFINLYKEGIWSLDRLNELLSGFFTVKFEVGYFDPEKKDWSQAVVEYPVAFLPAESKLLELRAAMDRALDIYREAYRAVIGAVRSYVLTPDEAKQRLGAIVNEINKKFFSATIKAISGRELSLVLDEGYFGAWTEYAKLLADVEARERTRFYARYLLWSVLWGLRWGYTTEEEAERWVNDLVAVMHEHEYVRQAIWLAVDFMVQRFFKEIKVRAIINLLRSRRISMEEAVMELTKLGFKKEQAVDYINANVVWYTPGLTTYATLLEIVPEAITTSIRAIEHFNLPSDELQHWITYVVRKPIQDELTLLRTRIYNALASGMTVEEVVAVLKGYSMTFKFERGELRIEGAEKARKLLEFYEANKGVFQSFGIAPHEWVMYNVIAEFERRIDELRTAARERVPSPSTLGVLAEYLVIPERMVEEALRRYGVSQEWLPIWKRYIRVKPIKSDYKSLLSTAVRALRYGAITEEQWKQYLRRALEHGFTELEIQILRERAELEIAITEAREYIPTPSMLATMAEYVAIPAELINRVFEARRVPEEWRPIWLQYIQARALADDARALMYSYLRAKARGAELPRDVEDKVREILSEVGITEKEISIRLLAEQIESMIEYIPTLGTLASMAEYIEVPMDYVRKILQLRRVEKTFAELWVRYIHARMISSEVNRVVTQYVRIYEYFTVPQELARQIKDLMLRGGWTSEELRIFELELQLRKAYRIMTYLIPTIRQFASDARYIPEWERLFEDLLRARGIDVRKYQQQIDYYRKLIRNRMVWRQISWYRNRLVYAFANGVIDENTLRQKLQALKKYGLTDEEIEL